MKNFEVFKNKTILITGHTGFKGAWLAIWLVRLGAKVIGISDSVPSAPSHYEAAHLKEILQDHRIDIRDSEGLSILIKNLQPDFIFHLAAQALVRQAYEDPLKTLTVNAIGTANILNSLRGLEKRTIVVMVTSDKAYDNVEWVWGYRENDRLGGKDPYSASKGMAEMAIRTFVDSFFSKEKTNIRLGIARAGNVIGGGDWAADRIVPDCMRAWSRGEVVDIRSPYATRPWQHVLEPLSGYLKLACLLSEEERLHGEAFNFGPAADQNRTVKDLIEEMSGHWSNIRWNDVSKAKVHEHEASLLKLNCDKAMIQLNWRSVLDFSETVKMTVDWYKHYYNKNVDCMMNITENQIDFYTLLAKRRGGI